MVKLVGIDAQPRPGRPRSARRWVPVEPRANGLELGDVAPLVTLERGPSQLGVLTRPGPIARLNLDELGELEVGAGDLSCSVSGAGAEASAEADASRSISLVPRDSSSSSGAYPLFSSSSDVPTITTKSAARQPIEDISRMMINVQRTKRFRAKIT